MWCKKICSYLPAIFRVNLVQPVLLSFLPSLIDAAVQAVCKQSGVCPPICLSCRPTSATCCSLGVGSKCQLTAACATYRLSINSCRCLSCGCGQRHGEGEGTKLNTDLFQKKTFGDNWYGFLWARYSFCLPTVSVKSLKGTQSIDANLIFLHLISDQTPADRMGIVIDASISYQHTVAKAMNVLQYSKNVFSGKN